MILALLITTLSFAKDAPDFKLEVLDGKQAGQTLTLKNFKDKLLVLEWSNPDCPFVKKHYDKSGAMPKLQATYTKKGIQWGIVLSGKTAKKSKDSLIEHYRKDQKIPDDALILLDGSGEVGHAYGAKTTPHMFVIDKKAKLAYYGAIDDHVSSDQEGFDKAKNFVAPVLDALLAKKSVTQKPVPSYGCSVKYE